MPLVYATRLLRTAEELRAAFALRHSVFHEEHHGRTLESGLDHDEIDAHCDHLGLFHEPSGQLVGTYRLVSSQLHSRFYTQGRFDLSDFFRLPGTKLELGRACVHRDHRTGPALGLLWKGISRYASAIEARWLFGSASVRLTDPDAIARLYAWLERAGVSTNAFALEVVPGRRIPQFAERVRRARGESSDGIELPPLFASYLKAGARIAGEPAYDAYLFCADFFAVLDASEMSARYRRRFGITTPPAWTSSPPGC